MIHSSIAFGFDRFVVVVSVPCVVRRASKAVYVCAAQRVKKALVVVGRCSNLIKCDIFNPIRMDERDREAD